jgi:hypothetical protein
MISKKGDVHLSGYQTFWANKLSTPKSEYQTLVLQYRDPGAQLKHLLKVLGDIEDVARYISVSVGESADGLPF